MGALQYVDVPDYNALILRRTFRDLNQPEAIMNRAISWLRDTDAKWNANDKRFTFPSGATLTFGYLEKTWDHLQYQGAELQYIAFDELTQFEEYQFTYLFSRLRRKAGVQVPLRMRSASNPGGPGHGWVKDRYIQPTDGKKRIFIPSLLIDNPGVDQQEYMESLSELDAVTRAQLLAGDWDATYSGGVFQREWFGEVVDSVPATQADPIETVYRRWDLAATEPTQDNKDPDYTAGVKLCRLRSGKFYVMDVVRCRHSAGQVEQIIKATAAQDGRAVPIRIEQEPGSAGKSLIHHYVTDVLPGYDVAGVPSSGSKLDRAKPVSAQAEHGNIGIVRGPWNADFINELVWFKGDNTGHDDQVDALCGAFEDIVLGDEMPPVPQIPVAGRGSSSRRRRR